MAGVASPSTQKLNFQSAMQDFVTMFPHLDTHLIERVLRSNNGMVDHTIDHLLAISCDDPDVSGAFIDAHQPPPQNRQPVAQRNQSPSGAFSSGGLEPAPPSYAYPATPYPATPYPATPYQPTPSPAYPPRPQSNYPTLSSFLPPGDLTLTPREAQPSIQKYGQVPVDVMGVQFRVPYTAPLPDAFLRLTRPIASQQQGSPMEGQLSEDREFALFLHNEELLHQARNNSEFMRTLQQAERATHVDPATGLPPDLPVCSTPSTSDGTSEGASEGNTSISERLAVTGKATRSKLLKIAKRLHLAKRSNTLILKKQSSVGKSTQRLINEDDDDQEEDRYLYNEEGEDLEEDDDEDSFAEMKTIPRQNTIDGYEQASRDACDVRIRSSSAKYAAPEQPFRPAPSDRAPSSDRAPPPDPFRAPPPRLTSVTPEPPPLSTLKRVSGIDFDDFAASRNSTGTGSSTLTPPKVPSTLPPDLLYDSAYDEGPEYFTAEDILRRPTGASIRNVSNLQPSSDEQSVYNSPSDGMSVCSFSTIGTNEFDTMGANGFSRKIHSETLNSSYIIPIQPVTLQADESVYDNLPNDKSRNTKTENLINFD